VVAEGGHVGVGQCVDDASERLDEGLERQHRLERAAARGQHRAVEGHAAGGFHDQPGLADARLAGGDDQRDLAVGRRLPGHREAVQLVAATDEPAAGATPPAGERGHDGRPLVSHVEPVAGVGAADATGRRRSGAGLGQHGRGREPTDLEHGRVVAEDRVLERAEARRPFQPDLREQLAHVVGAPDGIGLATGAVQGHEEVLPQALAQRVGGDQLLELGDQAGGSAAEVGGDAVLEDGQAHGFEALGLTFGERLVGELRQRGAAPLGQGGMEALAGQVRVAGGERLAARPGGPLEVPGVERVLTELEHVAGCPTHEERGRLTREPGGLEHAPQPGHGAVEAGIGPRGGPGGPQGVDQRVDRDGLARAQQQHREQGPVLALAEGERRSGGVDHLDRTQDAELHRTDPSPWPPTNVADPTRRGKSPECTRRNRGTARKI
jgi:hypothetical protein